MQEAGFPVPDVQNFNIVYVMLYSGSKGVGFEGS